MDKKLTPIQESIQYWQERYNEANDGFSPMFAEAAGLFLQYLRVMETKEKQFIGEVWDAAMTTFNESGGPADDFLYTKETFVNQYYKD